MKTYTIAIITLIGAGIFSGCTSESSDQNTNNMHEHESYANAPVETGNPRFNNGTTEKVYEQYINLKSALVKSDAAEAKTSALALKTALTNAESKTGIPLASQIAAASDIKTQRNAFDPLSIEVERIIKSTGLKSGKIYKQYCPMAKDGDGAYWLAEESAIKNPYYGDEMLECGEVKEVLQ